MPRSSGDRHQTRVLRGRLARVGGFDDGLEHAVNGSLGAPGERQLRAQAALPLHPARPARAPGHHHLAPRSVPRCRPFLPALDELLARIDLSLCSRCSGPMGITRAFITPEDIAAELRGAGLRRIGRGLGPCRGVFGPEMALLPARLRSTSACCSSAILPHSPAARRTPQSPLFPTSFHVNT